MVLGSSATGT